MSDQLHDTVRFLEDFADAPDDVIAAVGKASEALEMVERARGHLYAFHQLMGGADLAFGEAADMLCVAGHCGAAEVVEREVVGRNVLDGRWSFQIVEEFDALYWRVARATVSALEQRYQHGRRHVYEARMKEQRRTKDHAGHEHRPKAAHDPRIETDPSARR